MLYLALISATIFFGLLYFRYKKYITTGYPFIIFFSVLTISVFSLLCFSPETISYPDKHLNILGGGLKVRIIV